MPEDGEGKGMNKSKSNAPKGITKPQLATVGLTLIRQEPLVVQCQVCGVEWRPLRLTAMRWWLCHNGCNKPAEE
jgi:hypothetical protein